MKVTFIHTGLVLLVTALLAGCASQQRYVPPEPLPSDTNPAPVPEYRGAPNDFADALDKQLILQGDQMCDLTRAYRNVTDQPMQALNVDAFGEVPNSTWFTNRNRRSAMSLEEIARGPNTGAAPDPTTTWTITRAKAEGVTPGFHIVDGHGERYVIKFDPIGYSGLNSGADVVGAKLFYAAGYNTPENYIIHFDPSILEMGDGVKIVDEKGRKRLMTEQDMEEILARVEYREDGTIRALASKYIPGDLLGPFHFEGVRKDDPNDFVPHEHRRELRGQKIFAVWVNHIDAKAANSMDTYLGEPGEGHVVHYMMDFGTTLGSGGRGPHPRYRGHQNELDPHGILFKMLTLGFWVEEWEKPDTVEHPSAGRFSPTRLDPDGFKFIFPNPAYDNCTDLDAYWGAKVVMAFRDDQIRAAVATGQYPKDAEDFLVNTLISRRDIIGRYWFDRAPPMDWFDLGRGDDGWLLTWTDLAVEYDLAAEGETRYSYVLSMSEEEDAIQAGEIKQTELSLGEELRLSGDEQLEITLRLRRQGEKDWSRWVKVYVERDEETGEPVLVGVVREE